jgi:hypothetical protein
MKIPFVTIYVSEKLNSEIEIINDHMRGRTQSAIILLVFHIDVETSFLTVDRVRE